LHFLLKWVAENRCDEAKEHKTFDL
jgi:hypothetical protein